MNRHLAKLVTVSAAVLLFAGATTAANWNTTGPTNMFGGAIYAGPPALAVTAALVKTGGGPEHFTIQKALVSMLGAKTVNCGSSQTHQAIRKKESCGLAEWVQLCST